MLRSCVLLVRACLRASYRTASGLVTAATTAAATVTTAAAAATAATATAATTTVTAAAAAAATTGTRTPLLGLVHAQLTPTELLLVARLDRGLRIALRTHLHEAETARTPGLTVRDDLDLYYRPAVPLEHFAQLVLGRLEGEVPYKKPGSHFCPIFPFAHPYPSQTNGKDSRPQN